jgi:preprotein translocase subunit SecE
MKRWMLSTRSFFKQMLEELKKASWPDVSELRNLTFGVLLMVVFLTLFTSAVDFSLYHVVQLFSTLGRPPVVG